MRIILMTALFAVLLGSLQAHASDVNGLATCTVKIFKEISRTQKWSGKSPAGCPSTVAVEKRPEGAYVTIWQIVKVDGGWVNTAFSTAEGFWEIADKKELARANRDIMARAKRLDKCLDSIVAANDPLECRQKAIKSYNAGDVIGTEMRKTIWLDDDGRYAVVEFSYGDSTTAPEEPADIIETPPLPAGMVINVIPRVGSGKGGKSSSGSANPATTGTAGSGSE